MNRNTRNIIIVAAIILLGILVFWMMSGQGTAPTPASTTTAPADTTQPATDNNTQTQ